MGGSFSAPGGKSLRCSSLTPTNHPSSELVSPPVCECACVCVRGCVCMYMLLIGWRWRVSCSAHWLIRRVSWRRQQPRVSARLHLAVLWIRHAWYLLVARTASENVLCRLYVYFVAIKIFLRANYWQFDDKCR